MDLEVSLHSVIVLLLVSLNMANIFVPIPSQKKPRSIAYDIFEGSEKCQAMIPKPNDKYLPKTGLI